MLNIVYFVIIICNNYRNRLIHKTAVPNHNSWVAPFLLWSTVYVGCDWCFAGSSGVQWERGKVGSEERWPSINGLKILQHKEWKEQDRDQLLSSTDWWMYILYLWHDTCMYMGQCHQTSDVSQQGEDKCYQCWWLYHVGQRVISGISN